MDCFPSDHRRQLAVVRRLDMGRAVDPPPVADLCLQPAAIALILRIVPPGALVGVLHPRGLGNSDQARKGLLSRRLVTLTATVRRE